MRPSIIKIDSKNSSASPILSDTTKSTNTENVSGAVTASSEPYPTISPTPPKPPTQRDVTFRSPPKNNEEFGNTCGCINWWKKWWCPVFCEFLCGLQMSVLLRLSQLPNRFKDPQSSDAYIVTVGCIAFTNIQSFGRRSGGFGNPAVTFAAFVAGRIGWRHTIVYSIAESIGCSIGVGIVYLMHPPGTNTLKVCHFLTNELVMKLMFGEILQTIVIALVGCAVWRPWRRNEFVPAPPKYPIPPNDPLLSIKLGMMVSGICYSTGWIRAHGGGANPALALATALEGQCWNMLWLFWLSPVLGCSIGAALYRFVLVPIPKGRKKSFVFA